MLAETYIKLDRFLVGELALDAQEPIEKDGTTYVTWQGFSSIGPVRYDLVLAPASDTLQFTLFDDDIEQELATELLVGVINVERAAAVLDRTAARLEANV